MSNGVLSASKLMELEELKGGGTESAKKDGAAGDDAISGGVVGGAVDGAAEGAAEGGAQDSSAEEPKEGSASLGVETICVDDANSESSYTEGASATDKGTAFHMLAEWSAKHFSAACNDGEHHSAKLPVPPQNVIEKIAKQFNLSVNDKSNLQNMQLPLWLNSDIAAKIASFKYVKPEVPFFVQLGSFQNGAAQVQAQTQAQAQGLPQQQLQDLTQQVQLQEQAQDLPKGALHCVQDQLHLEGFIDLLAYDELGKGEAFVVDYKTGTSLLPNERRAHYQIQAYTYAYVALLQGFSSVRLTFVYVDEHPDKNGQPFCIEYPNPDGTDIPFTLESLGAKLQELL